MATGYGGRCADQIVEEAVADEKKRIADQLRQTAKVRLRPC